MNEKLIAKLTTGQIIKNYKELCSLLDLPVLGGKSKTYQLKELERYIDYTKEGQKFIITNIYSSPKEKEDKRLEQSVYLKYIQILLMDLLVNRMDEHQTYSVNKTQLCLDLGMVNSKYKHEPLYLVNHNIPDYQIMDYDLDMFYDKCNSRLTDILELGLSGLANRCLIDWSKIKTPLVKDEQGFIGHLPITNQIRSQILDVEFCTLHAMGYDSMEQIKATRQMKKFYEVRNQQAQELYGWFGIQDKYQIIYREEHIREALPKDQIYFNKLLLNEQVQAALSRSFHSMIHNRNEQANAEYQTALLARPPLAVGTRSTPTMEELKIFHYNEDTEAKMSALVHELVAISPIK